jgi:hypothetical protein
LVTRSWSVVPDDGLSVFRALKGTATMRGVREQQQRTANKKASRGHGFGFFKQSSSTERNLTRSGNLEQE